MKLRLTKAGRIVVFILVAAIVVGACAVGIKFSGILDKDNKENDVTIETTDSHTSNPTESVHTHETKPTSHNKDNNDSKTINLSLDEWIGWKPIIDANGGLKTKDGSIFDKLGINVNIHVVNDADASSNALIKGDLNATGYTMNRVAFLSSKFANENFNVVMPVFTNYSNGGDGIIAMNGYDTVESLVGAKIGVPKFSEAQSLVVWFVNKSDLSQEDKQTILDNLILLDNAEMTGQSFFAGSLDVAATWQPYLNNAKDSTNSHVLFDTTSSNKLIMDGILFSRDFAEKNPEVVSAFIDGIFKAESMYDTEFSYIREVMPMFASSTDEEIKAMCGDAGLMNYNKNYDSLKNECPVLYEDMCDVWDSIGESTDHDLGNDLFDTTYIEALSDKYSSVVDDNNEKFEITDEEKNQIKDYQALLSKSATVNFVPDTAKFLDAKEANGILMDFVDIARILDGTIIQIEGNINTDVCSEDGQKLSEERAKAVKNFFVANGIDSNRIIVVGNGNSKMKVDPNSEDTTVNRRTDVFFKTIEK